MGATHTIISLYIGNSYNSNYDKRFGSSYIWVGNDATPWSTALIQATSRPFHDSGFINLDFPVQGRYVVIRREGNASGVDNKYSINQVRVYGITNLLYYGAQILKAPEPVHANLVADNLITNLRTRSLFANRNPLIDSIATRASFNSCF